MDVEEEDVDPLGRDLLEALRGIGRLANDLHASGGLQHPPQALEREGLVVDEKGAQHRARTHAVAARGSQIVTSVPPS